MEDNKDYNTLIFFKPIALMFPSFRLWLHNSSKIIYAIILIVFDAIIAIIIGDHYSLILGITLILATAIIIYTIRSWIKWSIFIVIKEGILFIITSVTRLTKWRIGLKSREPRTKWRPIKSKYVIMINT